MSRLALTGVPRGGTTLACRLLGEAEDTLALFEPMPVETLPTDAECAVEQVIAYFDMVRAKVQREARAPSKHLRGEVPDNPFGDAAAGGARPLLAELGEIAVDKPLGPAFHLVIKHNAAFLALLPELVARMPVVGVVRHPLAVLASWHSVELPVSHGHMPAGERLDARLAARLAALPALLPRQLALLDWCFDRLLRHVPPASLLRYEDIVADGGAGLYAAAGVQGVPRAGLRQRNASVQYARAGVALLADALLAHGGPAVDFYGRAAVTTLARQMTGAGRG